MLNTIVTDNSQSLINDLSLSKFIVPHQLTAKDCCQKIDILIEEMIKKLSEKPRGYEMYVKGSLYIIFSILDQNSLIQENSMKTIEQAIMNPLSKNLSVIFQRIIKTPYIWMI